MILLSNGRGWSCNFSMNVLEDFSCFQPHEALVQLDLSHVLAA